MANKYCTVSRREIQLENNKRAIERRSRNMVLTINSALTYLVHIATPGPGLWLTLDKLIFIGFCIGFNKPLSEEQFLELLRCIGRSKS